MEGECLSIGKCVCGGGSSAGRGCLGMVGGGAVDTWN